MMLGRLFLCLGAVLLLCTALVHSTGGAMVSGWLEGQRQAVLSLAWYLLAIDWVAVGLVWLYCAWRADRRLVPIGWLAAIIPAAAGIGLIIAVGPGFFGIWMLLGATLFAGIGLLRLR